MSKKNILLAITNGLWLIDAPSAEQLGENVAAVLSGEKFWDTNHKSKAEFVIVSQNEGSYFSSDLSKAPQGSVAVISISGPIMKEDNCGDPGTKTYEQLLKQAESNPNIAGVVLCIDSPGGTVSGTQSLSNLIKNFSKPVVTLAEDLMASAAYWIGSSAKYVMANTGTTRVGSIGTMLSFADMQPVWEKAGVKFHEIYATGSSAKNKDFAEARKGNYEGIIKNTLDPLNNEFTGSVKNNRGTLLNHDKTLNGQVYVASDALKYGLIDGIGNLNDAVAKVHELSASTIQENLTEKNQMKKITLLATHAALLAICGATIAAGETSVDVELSDELLNKINSSLAEQTEKLTKAETELADLKAENEKLKSSSAGATTTKKEGDDKIESDQDDEFLTSVDKEKLRLKKEGLI